MNYMIFQRKNNNLIRIQKNIYYFNYQAAEPFSFERFSFTSKLLLDSWFPICVFHFLYFRIPRIVLSMWGQWDVKQIWPNFWSYYKNIGPTLFNNILDLNPSIKWGQLHIIQLKKSFFFIWVILYSIIWTFNTCLIIYGNAIFYF